MTSMLCLAGGIASGKTTVARGVHEAVPGSCVVSFGDVVRQRIADLGLPPERASLQRVGEQLISAGWPTFVAALVRDVDLGSSLLIVDGVRHIEATEALRAAVPEARQVLIFVAVEPTVQRQRLAMRGESPESLTHPMEQNLDWVRAQADLVVAGDRPVREALPQILRLLGLDVHTTGYEA